MKADERLLREYIQIVLRENEYGDLAMADAMMSPWGVSFGSGDDLFNIFVKPFTDVVQTAMGKTKELSQRGQTLVRVAFETIATTLIPVLTDSYNEIFERDKEKIDKIRSEYAEVYQSNWDAFKDEDFQFLAFMYNPANYISVKIVDKSPKAALGIISVLTGGSIDGYLDKIKAMFNIGAEEGPHRAKRPKNVEDVMGGGMGGGYDVGWSGMEGLVREDAGVQPQKPSLEQVLSNPKLLAKINGSPLAQRMRRDAQATLRSSLATVYKQAAAVLGAKSLQDLQHKLGKKLPGTEKLDQVEPQARQAAEQQIMKGVKASMKTFYVKSLEQQAKKAGGDVATDYEKLIGKVKGL